MFRDAPYEHNATTPRTKQGQVVVDLLEADDVGMLEFSQVLYVRLLLLTHLLDGHLLRAELAQENSSLSTTAQPLQFRNLLKRNLPHIWKQISDRSALSAT